jgi:D-alanyl-D-alanine carboxypeptidase/D-alanyl-D-alanine-endopeptidase (penicillin-binding protein 4)
MNSICWYGMKLKSFKRLFVTGLTIYIGSQLLVGEFSRAAGEIDPKINLTEQITKRLNAKIKLSKLKESNIGAWVGVKTDSGFITYYALNGDRPVIPASLSKLVTAGAVLHELPPGYKFKTQLMADSAIKNGTLNGDLYLKGGGDPAFVSENMWFLVNELLRNDIKSIDGDVIVDDSRFDSIRFGKDRQSVRVDRAYDAPVGAMSMNWNSAAVYIRPGDKVGDKLKVFIDISSPYIKLRNQSKTAAAGHGKKLTVERVSESGFDGDVIEVSGALAIDQAEAVYYKSISKPDLWAGSNLIEFLKQRGVSVKGRVRSGVVSASAKVLATAESKPIQIIVADMAKWSNNYVAEMLVKNLAAEMGESPATMSGGLKKVQDFLAHLGFKVGDYEFVNAAGFTRENKFTPSQLGKFLESMRSDFEMFPEYLSALPIAGIDGTLRSRMKSTSAERLVRAKTGLLDGVVGLAGFAGRPNGSMVSFTFIYNGSGNVASVRELFDQMAAELVME